MTPPLTEQRLAEMEERYISGLRTFSDIPELIAEIRRLRDHLIATTERENTLANRANELLAKVDDAESALLQKTQQLQRAGIELPVMYQLGFNNNNCIGCVKGGMGYWNRIRVHFPEVFNRMAELERHMNAAIIHNKQGKMFLDELPEDSGRHSEPEIDCSLLCIGAESTYAEIDRLRAMEG